MTLLLQNFDMYLLVIFVGNLHCDMSQVLRYETFLKFLLGSNLKLCSFFGNLPVSGTTSGLDFFLSGKNFDVPDVPGA